MRTSDSNKVGFLYDHFFGIGGVGPIFKGCYCMVYGHFSFPHAGKDKLVSQIFWSFVTYEWFTYRFWVMSFPDFVDGFGKGWVSGMVCNYHCDWCCFRRFFGVSMCQGFSDVFGNGNMFIVPIGKIAI